MHDVAEALDLEEARHADRADPGDAADVVASQVDQHHVLGVLFWIGQQFPRPVGGIQLRSRAAQAGAGQRPYRHLAPWRPRILSWRTSISGEAPTT